MVIDIKIIWHEFTELQYTFPTILCLNGKNNGYLDTIEAKAFQKFIQGCNLVEYLCSRLVYIVSRSFHEWD
jgi:hypothetical protein